MKNTDTTPSLAEKIAVALLTPHGGPECHRLQIKQRIDHGITTVSSPERDMGGHNKQSVIDTINRVLYSSVLQEAPEKTPLLVWLPSTKLWWPGRWEDGSLWSNSHGRLNKNGDKWSPKATAWMLMPPPPNISPL